jgi:hypothetical protein
MDRLLHDIDARLDGLVVSEHLGALNRQGSMKRPGSARTRGQTSKATILTELSKDLAERVSRWEARALEADTASLKKWHTFVKKQNHATEAPVSLYDPMHKSFFKELIHQQKVNGNKWRRANVRRERTHSDAFWPMAKFIDGNKQCRGFGVFDMNVNHPSYPTILDEEGTFSDLYCSLLPALQLSKLLDVHRSSGIHQTLLCKGAGEFYKYPNGKFAPPKIPRAVKHPDDFDRVAEDAEESDDDDDDDDDVPKDPYNGEPRPHKYWDSDQNLEGGLRDKTTEPSAQPEMALPVDAAPPSDEPNTGEPQLLPSDDPAPTEEAPIDEENAAPPEDLVAVPEPMPESQITNLPNAKCCTLNENPGEFEIQGGYITALNMKEYFLAALHSKPVQEAVARKNAPHPTDKVNRVSVWVYLKAHMLMITWDTLIDDRGAFLHQIYLTSSYPEYIYHYKDDYRDGTIYKDVLATFVECLNEMPASYLNGLPVRVFEEIAIRAKLRRLFLKSDVQGYDLNCTAFMMLGTIYQALVLNVVTQVDERGEVGPGDEMIIATESSDHIARFATLNTKRFFRSLLYRFDIDFRKLLHANIHAGRVVCFDPTIAPSIISVDTVQLTTFDHTQTQSHIEFSHQYGFMHRREPRTLRSGNRKPRRPRMQR